MIVRTLGAALLFAGSAAGVALTQPRLATTVRGVREAADVYLLPPPAELRTATLGWRAAAVDFLWTQLLVDYGIHWSEHREFSDIPSYVDGILALEPTFAPLYQYIDTMLAYRPLQGTEKDVRLARAYLERGTRERPDDASVWLQYGQFIAFIGPGFIQDEREREAWRRDGAEAVGHAAELDDDSDRALTAASILDRAGATQAARRYLERAYALTEDSSMSEVHEGIGRKLAALEGAALRQEADATARSIQTKWKAEAPLLSRDQFLLVGPTVDVWRCAGLAGARDPACARDWVSETPSLESSASSP